MIDSVLKTIEKDSNLPIIIIAGPIISDAYVKLNKLILSPSMSPKLNGIGHCVIEPGVWPHFDNSFLTDLPTRLSIQELITGCPPHPIQSEKILTKY